MDSLTYKTISSNKNTVDKKWVLVDASEQTLGRMCSKIAKLLRGKYKPNFTPHVDCGDNVVVINAEKIILSGNKWESKEYIRYTGYPGGQKFTSAQEMLEKHPERLIEKAIKGMLPKNTLGRALYRNLKVYTGSEHNHDAQKPEVLNLDTLK